jgi:small-conductance mechanosensitive channel
MAELAEILNYSLAGNLVSEYAFAVGVLIALSIVFRLFKVIIIKRLEALSKRTETDFDDLVISIVNTVRWPFYVLLALWIALQFINVPEIVSNIVFYIVLVAAGVYIVKGVTRIIDYGAGRYVEEQHKHEKNADTSIVDLLVNILKVIVWIFAIFIVLSNMRIDITPMIAGLGIGGVALAFGFQSILKDVFAAFSIYFDKPFRKGDFITIGNDSGTVENIGIKSTRIKTLQGQELVVSNQELTDTRVNNFKKMNTRRISFDLGITYETPTEKMKKIPGIIEKIFASVKIAELSRVHFKSFGDFNLIYSIVYNVKSKDYVKYMDAQQEINLKIKEAFEKARIDFAYPTQLHYNKKA